MELSKTIGFKPISLSACLCFMFLGGFLFGFYDKANSAINGMPSPQAGVFAKLDRTNELLEKVVNRLDTVIELQKEANH